MNAIEAQVQNGYLVSVNPVDLPEGATITVRADDIDEEKDPLLGTSPEAIARWLAEFDALPVPTMTDEEYGAWQSARRAQRDYERATFDARMKKLDGLFE